MSIPLNETIVMDIAGVCARVYCEDPAGRARLVALGFNRENDQWVRPIANDEDRVNLISEPINSRALFSGGRDWSPSELVDYYREQGAVPNGYRMISWISPDKILLSIVDVLDASRSLQINCSVWDNSPTVSWSCDGAEVSVHLTRPPIAVAHLPKSGMIAVVGDYDEFGSANLLFYSYDGSIRKIFSAPAMGGNAQFGGITENADGVRVTVGFQSDAGWREQAGQLNVSDGSVGDLHRNY